MEIHFLQKQKQFTGSKTLNYQFKKATDLPVGFITRTGKNNFLKYIMYTDNKQYSVTAGKFAVWQ
jgi:hypothetical protein